MTEEEMRENSWRAALTGYLAVYFSMFWKEVIDEVSGSPRFGSLFPVSELLFYEGVLAILSLGPAYLICFPIGRSNLRSLLRIGAGGAERKPTLPSAGRIIAALAVAFLGRIAIGAGLAGSGLSEIARQAILLSWTLICCFWILFSSRPSLDSDSSSEYGGEER